MQWFYLQSITTFLSDRLKLNIVIGVKKENHTRKFVYDNNLALRLSVHKTAAVSTVRRRQTHFIDFGAV